MSLYIYIYLSQAIINDSADCAKLDMFQQSSSVIIDFEIQIVPTRYDEISWYRKMVQHW